MAIATSMTALERLRTRVASEGLAILPLRVMLGFGFADHGYAKLARGMQSFTAVLTALNVPAPGVSAWLTTILELLGGISLMLGLFVVPFSVPLATIMLTALFSVHLQFGFSSIKLLAIDRAGVHFGPTGYELNLLYLVGLLTLVSSRPSQLSLDHWITTAKPPARAFQKRSA